MTCPECGYDGDEWLHDAVKRSDGGNGYICPRCNHHQLVYPAYRARLNECERQKESGGDGG